MCSTCGCKGAESFEAENDNKIHVLKKEYAVDNQYGKYDGEEYFEMDITQYPEELRGKVKQYLDDLVSGDGIYEYLEKTTFKDEYFIDDKIYTAQEAEIKAKIDSPDTPLSDLVNLLNKMSKALEGSRGDYGESYSYYTPRDKVLKISGINDNDFYMAESFEAEDKKVVGYIILSGDRYANYAYVSTNAEKLKQSCKDSFMENNYDFEEEELEKMWDNFSLKEAVEATGMYLKEVDLSKAILIYDGDADALNAESFEAPKSPALKNLSTIAVLALAIFVGKKLKK